MHLFTTEDAEETEVNLVHAGAEMNESFLSTIKLKRFFVKFGGNLFFISTFFFFLNPIKSCRYVCFLVTLKTPHH